MPGKSILWGVVCLCLTLCGACSLGSAWRGEPKAQAQPVIRGEELTDRIHGALVGKCVREKRDLGSLSLEELKAECPLFEADVYEAIALTTCVERRNLRGGPAPEAVLDSIRRAEEWLGAQAGGEA